MQPIIKLGIVLIFFFIIITVTTVNLASITPLTSIKNDYITDTSNAISGYSLTNSGNHQITIEINYPGHWNGYIGDSQEQNSVQGYGNQKYKFTSDYADANIYKIDGNSGTLKVNIYVDGLPIKSITNTNAYGSVSISSGYLR